MPILTLRSWAFMMEARVERRLNEDEREKMVRSKEESVERESVLDAVHWTGFPSVETPYQTQDGFDS